MFSPTRPYLILPKLIEQPTWGGDYIARLKNLPKLFEKKIGQSYELFSGSKLLLNILNTSDPQMTPDMGNADTSQATNETAFEEDKDYVVYETIQKTDADDLLGPQVKNKSPLLIKINHAFGNSFQLHIKPSLKDSRWQPKAESWYYLENGLVTCGIKQGINLDAYKDCCVAIEKRMKELSAKVQNDELTLQQAKDQAKDFIAQQNPWQYVNVCEMPQYSLLDLSLGGIHHSWEENREKLPLGNVIYEVQQDVMDPVCTIRSFDQGKFKADGTIREIQIDDYFKYLDTNPQHNDVNYLTMKREGEKLLRTSHYCLDILEFDTETSQTVTDSFHHLFVREGQVKVKTKNGEVIVGKGHSCFVPYAVDSYSLEPLDENAVVLKTFVQP